MSYEIDPIPDSYDVPIDPVDLRLVADMLRERDVFTQTFSVDVDLYDPAIYPREFKEFSTSTKLLVDRNLITRWVGLVNGARPTDEHRIAAGVLAFAQCADIILEPNIALYEVGNESGNDIARDELLRFRVANQIHPGYWAEIALSKSDRLEFFPAKVPLSSQDLTVDFSVRLRRWQRNYILSLKLAELELEGGTAASRMSRLLDWMYGEFLMGGPAMALAARYLVPGANRKRLLKGIRSAKRETAIAGVKNAAWDLTLVSEWTGAIKNQESQAQLGLLGSLDRNVHVLARTVADVKGKSLNVFERTCVVFSDLFGDQPGRKLAEQYLALQNALDDPGRQMHRPVPPDFISNCIVAGEDLIRRWQPGKA